jgi:transposase
MLDEFLKAQAGLPKGGHRWWWDHAGLSDVQKQAVAEALARPDVSDKAVQIVLADWGVKVTRQQVGHLRRRLADG